MTRLFDDQPDMHALEGSAKGNARRRKKQRPVIGDHAGKTVTVPVRVMAPNGPDHVWCRWIDLDGNENGPIALPNEWAIKESDD